MKARHDNLIRKFIADPKYEVYATGVITNSRFRRLGFLRPSELKLRNK